MSQCPFHLKFDNRFARLPDAFYTKMQAEGFAQNPFLIHADADMAALIGLDEKDLRHPEFASYFSGNKSLTGSEPLAMVYSGHQFGQWAGQLGDGRALLLGQVQGKDGKLWDLHLKGSGKTPYSRFGDGRAVLRSTIREYLGAQALFGLGIPTTRALCIIGTGEPVEREEWEPGALLVRTGSSHIRFGHFEHFFHHGQPEMVKILADYVMDNQVDEGRSDMDYAAWYFDIVERTAELIAMWQAAGFTHGVMNTDNMSVAGLTIDYGPFGFMERYDPRFIPNASDDWGRYRYEAQPSIAFWNLQAFAYALQPVLPFEAAQEILKAYEPRFLTCFHEIMCGKLGLENARQEDRTIWQSLFSLMHQQMPDYTLCFRDLCDVDPDSDNAAFLAHFRGDKQAAQKWLDDYFARVAREKPGRAERMKTVNPKYVLRNWVAETVIRAAEDHADYSLIDDMMQILRNPYDEHEKFSKYAALPPPEMENLCVSCSS